MQLSRDIVIETDATVVDALRVLNDTGKKTLICVEQDNSLAGVVADGDIRRGLLQGCALDSSVREVMNRSPIFISRQATQQQAESLLSSRIHVLPVVDEGSKLVGYYAYKEKSVIPRVKDKAITIVGMGYVGLTLGLVLADSGFHRVCGFDVNEELIGMLKNKERPFYEKELGHYLDLHANETLTFSMDINQCRSDIYVVTVGTPLIRPENKPNVEHVSKAARGVASVLEPGDLVVLRSTVPIGCTREVVIPLLEELSSLRCGRDFYVSFAPERTAEGAALTELRRNPQIIGGHDTDAFELTARLFNALTNSVIDVGSLEAAEMAKLVDNTFRDHLFAYSNYMAMLAERLGLDFHRIVDAVNFSYKRNMIPKPSPGVGGPCLSKDPYILKAALDRIDDLDSELLLATRRINELGPLQVKEKLQRLLVEAGKDLLSANKISILGLAFKGEPETSDLRDSTSLWFLDQLPRRDNVFAYDPVVSAEDIRRLGIQPATMEEAFDGADAVVILNNHASFAKADIDSLLATMNKPAVLIDTWQNFNAMVFKRQPGIIYGGLGND